MAMNEKGARPTQRSVLTSREAVTLDRVLRERYTQTGLNNVAFAGYVNTDSELRKLFRAPITQSHVRNGLLTADIAPNRQRSAPAHDTLGKCRGLTQRVQALEEQLAKLTAHLRGMK